jgi:L-seryl-tRNA(Ser) seleniumtransferase
MFIEGIRPNKQNWNLIIKEDTSQLGGGTMPGVEIPTIVVAASHNQLSSQQIFDELRLGNPAIVTRLKKDYVLIDFRTVTEEEIPFLINAILHID